MTGGNLALVIFLVIFVAILSIGFGYFLCSVKTRTRMENFKIKLMKIDYEIGKERLNHIIKSKNNNEEIEAEVLSFNSKEEMENFLSQFKNKKGE
jgi:hypothetical protein